MKVITEIANDLVFKRRQDQILRYSYKTKELQHGQFRWLLNKAKDTAFGQEHYFDLILGQGRRRQQEEAFRRLVPLSTYDQLKPWIERMLQGEEDVLWPGLCKNFAKSSGTTSDKSKYIPITRDALRYTHMRGGTDCVVIYLMINPHATMLDNLGKGLILGGSFSDEKFPKGIKAGDLSATLIQNVSPMVNRIRVPDKRIALMQEWEAKLDALTDAVMDEKNISSISGVPSWMLGVLEKILEKKGAKDISEVWPNLEVFFHGGIAFGPYRERYKKLIPSEKMHYLETYNASEGFFGIQSSWYDPALQLIVDNRIYYEFIPMSEYDESNPNMQAIPLRDVEVGVNYAMVISTPGLWRYIVGDTVKFTQKDPFKFVITGRTKAFINAFGEELMVSNADEALVKTCDAMSCEIADYTAAPTFAEDGKKAHHSWVIEFRKAPDDMQAFADLLDKNLQSVNSDYEAKRYKGIFLGRLELIPAPAGTFNEWLKQKKGKLGGQIKIPRLSNSRRYFEELCEIINNPKSCL